MGGAVEIEDKVWVLVASKDGRHYPEAHKTLKGCVDSVIADLKENRALGHGTRYRYGEIRKELSVELHWEDDVTEWEYSITSCPVWK